MRPHYAIFWAHPLHGRAVWCRASNKREALAHGKAVQGTVYAVTFGRHMAWDAPTFKAQGDLIADYRVILDQHGHVFAKGQGPVSPAEAQALKDRTRRAAADLTQA